MNETVTVVAGVKLSDKEKDPNQIVTCALSTCCNRSAKTINMTTSMLTGSALQASRAAVTAAMEDQSVSSSAPEDLEPGEIQEIDMELNKFDRVVEVN